MNVMYEIIRAPVSTYMCYKSVFPGLSQSVLFIPRVFNQYSYLLVPGGDVSGVVVVGRQLVGKPVVQLLA